jgi:SNF2 family DNA or RNA helicase
MLAVMSMGTGKTILSIACAEDLLGKDSINLCMVVVPPSLKFQWARKLAEFTDLPTMKKKRKGKMITLPAAPQCVIIDGTIAQRKKQYASITSDTDYVILGYPNVVDDIRQVRKIRPGMVVCDEVTQIAGAGSARAMRIKQSLGWCEYRLGLTGTPMENGRPEELFSIMEWVDKTVLGEPYIFDSAFIDRRDDGQVTKYKNTPVLHDLMEQVWFRAARTDPDVAPYLPEMDEGDWIVKMDKPTRDAYYSMARDLHNALSRVKGSGSFDLASHYEGSGSMDTALGKAMSIHQACELLLDHPDLPVESAISYQKTNGTLGSKYCFEQWQAGLFDEVLDSPKLAELREKVETILAFDSRSKVLIYTQWRHMLDIIQDELGIPAVQYHGGMSAGAKDEAISIFTVDPSVRVFISSHAGAYGCDMFMANYLINYDIPWSNGRKDQIDHRHDRASSEFKKIYVRDMVVAGTIEERKHEMVAWKGKVWTAVRDRRGADKMGRVHNDVESLTGYLARTVPGI